jgi:signal transduction histidine kinase
MPIAEEKGLEVRVVRPAAGDRLGHPAALGRVLLNLVTNALKHTSEGFVEVGGCDRPSSRVAFTVRDTGPGMPADVVDQLFGRPDSRRAAPGRGFSSSGLGLAICRRLVSAMGGELRVVTEPGRGSCFQFDLTLPAGGPQEKLEAVRTG